jgi:hypothetical protein
MKNEFRLTSQPSYNAAIACLAHPDNSLLLEIQCREIVSAERATTESSVVEKLSEARQRLCCRVTGIDNSKEMDGLWLFRGYVMSGIEGRSTLPQFECVVTSGRGGNGNGLLTLR